MNKELYTVITTRNGNHYYYDGVQQILSPLHPILKYIIDNYLRDSRVDVEGINRCCIYYARL